MGQNRVINILFYHQNQLLYYSDTKFEKPCRSSKLLNFHISNNTMLEKQTPVGKIQNQKYEMQFTYTKGVLHLFIE